MSEGLVIKNRLRIVRRVGRGGMGHVYEVYHEVLRVRRALKQIVSDLQDNPEIERRFLHEAQMMARLEHPHIVKVFDVDHEPGFGTYLLMEFIQGSDLGTLLRERDRFSYEETLRIGQAVASALDCAHAAGLVHRDIKPANILLEEPSGRPVVTDFGIAKEVEGAGGEEGFTKTGSFIGTYRYSSREQIRAEKGVPVDGRADVYSLGVVLYEMSTGHRYLEGMAELKIASCVGYQDDWRPPLTFPDDLPESFRNLIERSVEPDRNRRVESARALMSGLQECLESIPVRTWTPGSPPPRGQAPPLAATATGGGAALQEVGEAATELDDSDTGITEERARDRARLVVRLQGLRKAVDGQSVEFERLLKALQGFDLPRDEFRQLDDMSQILHRVEESEREGQIDAAIASLEGLSDQLQRNSSRMESSIVAAVERTREDLEQRWRRLGELGDPWLERDGWESAERSLARVVAALAARRWDECRTALEEANAQIEGGWRNARGRAGRHVETGLTALADRLTTLREASPEDADRTGVTAEQVAADVTSALEQGQLGRATAAVDAALAALDRALAVVARREAEAVDAARAQCDAAFERLPRTSAERLDGEELRRAEARRSEAASAASAGDLRAARAGFADAAAIAAAVTGRVAEALAAERARVAAALRELVEQAKSAPAEVVGDARSAAEAALAEPAVADEPAIARLDAARATLAKSLAEAVHFEAAGAAEALAREALAEVRALSPSAVELTPGERQIAAARAALSKRDWIAAKDRFTEAATTLERLAREISERRERDDLESARTAAESLLAALPRERTAALAGPELAESERLLESARSASGEGERGAAKEAFAAAAQVLARIRDAIAADLVESTTALAAKWEKTHPMVADLLEARDLAEIEEPLASAQQTLDALQLVAADAALSRAEEALPRLRERAGARARERIDVDLRELDSAWADLARADPEHTPTEEERPEAVGRAAAALLDDGRSASAAALAASAAAAARKTAADAVARLRGECGAARDRLARLRAALADRQVPVAEAAPEELRAAAASETEARAREEAGALAGALAEWREAERALELARERVAERERALVASAAEDLRGVLASASGASEEIVGAASTAAAGALERASRLADGAAEGVASALEDLSEARRGLEVAIAEAAENERAKRARGEAEAARERATARSPKRRQLRAGERLERDAAKAFQRRRWDEAARGYQSATEAFAALDSELAAAQAATAAKAAKASKAAEVAAAATAAKTARAQVEAEEDATRVVTPPGPRPRVAAFAGAALALALVLGGWLWWRATPGPEPVPAPRADRAETKRAAPPPQEVARVEPKQKLEPSEKREEKAAPESVPAVPKVQPEAQVAPEVPKEVKPEIAKPEQVAVPKEEVARVEPSPVAPPPRPKIASFAPASPAVKVAEDGRETFRIALADVAGARPSIEWRLGDKVVAKDVPEFTFSPGFGTADKAKKTTVALVASVGGAEGPSQRWDVEITHVNRAPTLAGTTPPTAKPIQAQKGTKVALAADVNDPDRDGLKYSWTLDGKPLPGEGAKVEVPVNGDENVEMTATDGEKTVTAKWRIASIEAPFRIDTRPASLTRLAFASPQEFRADLPSGLGADGVEYEWTIDGRKAGTGSTFRFANDDPARVRKEPVKVALRAKDATGRSFSRDWSFLVSPPAPKLSGTTPQPGDLSIDRGGDQVFALAAAAPVGNQALEYVFEVDGRRVEGSDPKFAYNQRDDRPHTVVAYVRDNFDQASAKQRWNVRPSAPAADIVARARAWLSQYQDAFNRKDARRIGELRGLGADAVAKLQQALNDQQGLRVDFSNVQVERIDDGRARVTYDRTDRFTEARDGRPVERTGNVEQVVGVVGGQVKELETRRR